MDTTAGSTTHGWMPGGKYDYLEAQIRAVDCRFGRRGLASGARSPGRRAPTWSTLIVGHTDGTAHVDECAQLAN